jgi:hypothetical protein
MNGINFRDFTAVQTTDGLDWIVTGDIYDNDNVKIGTFNVTQPDGSVTGTSINQWWVRQPQEFQQPFVSQFSYYMAVQITTGAAL